MAVAEVTLADMIAEVRRTCHMQRDVYSRAVRERRMNARQAARRIDVMDALLARLEGEASDDSTRDNRGVDQGSGGIHR